MSSAGEPLPAGGGRPRGEPLLDRALEASLEHTVAGDEIRERILDAAAEIFARSGVRRSSIEDVARRAGVSRITVYRRFPTKNLLVEEVLLRDLRAFFVGLRVAAGKADTLGERIVEGFSLALGAARANPLFGGLIAVEPEAILPFLTTGGGSFLRTVSDFVATQLRREQAAGEMAETVDIRVVAEVLARITLSFSLTPDSYVDLNDPGQVRAFARGFLAPLVTGVGVTGDQSTGNTDSGMCGPD
ncbi:TetR/AcrR family transcriptional regulator [Frankia sp. Mgl5]|uniref:TetR/AcrR family transcriptional regulator n=1 Tax=Frankia sp. Mgl5 TaxID=2933793 RepID=UPI00200D81C7|nr:TetR/AcrR family transcriptional regulator [Frankia sp. Mgl5]MCK9929595.1 TetR/AcrR family transcriptional regulator [Frankia sp. Mgl5]